MKVSQLKSVILRFVWVTLAIVYVALAIAVICFWILAPEYGASLLVPAISAVVGFVILLLMRGMFWRRDTP
jgi:hypothetical protein